MRTLAIVALLCPVVRLGSCCASLRSCAPQALDEVSLLQTQKIVKLTEERDTHELYRTTSGGDDDVAVEPSDLLDEANDEEEVVTLDETAHPNVKKKAEEAAKKYPGLAKAIGDMGDPGFMGGGMGHGFGMGKGGGFMGHGYGQAIGMLSGKVDPFAARLKADTMVYAAKVAAERNVYDNSISIVKKAYIDNNNNEAKAALEVISADKDMENIANDEEIGAWYDQSPIEQGRFPFVAGGVGHGVGGVAHGVGGMGHGVGAFGGGAGMAGGWGGGWGGHAGGFGGGGGMGYGMALTQTDSKPEKQATTVNKTGSQEVAGAAMDPFAAALMSDARIYAAQLSADRDVSDNQVFKEKQAVIDTIHDRERANLEVIAAKHAMENANVDDDIATAYRVMGGGMAGGMAGGMGMGGGMAGGMAGGMGGRYLTGGPMGFEMNRGPIGGGMALASTSATKNVEDN